MSPTTRWVRIDAYFSPTTLRSRTLSENGNCDAHDEKREGHLGIGGN